MVDLKLIDVELKKKFDALITKFGEQNVANMLGVDPRSIENYKIGKNPNKGIIKKISESFDEYIIRKVSYKAQISGHSHSHTHDLIASQQSQIELLKKEVVRLEKECKANSDLKHHLQLSRAKMATTLQMLAQIQAKVEKVPIEKVLSELHKAQLLNYKEVLKEDTIPEEGNNGI